MTWRAGGVVTGWRDDRAFGKASKLGAATEPAGYAGLVAVQQCLAEGQGQGKAEDDGRGRQAASPGAGEEAVCWQSKSSEQECEGHREAQSQPSVARLFSLGARPHGVRLRLAETIMIAFEHEMQVHGPIARTAG
ncbi:hypothetical protein [Kineococcus radiotolerans]|uniref:hypothetical protein n=1 Tax=Kineococcus radiotolerans TaxID=131568 RepID=UPI0012FF446A|nr:hypothetical protein [Kineococcus radiotolerans]